MPTVTGTESMSIQRVECVVSFIRVTGNRVAFSLIIQLLNNQCCAYLKMCVGGRSAASEKAQGIRECIQISRQFIQLFSIAHSDMYPHRDTK